MVLPSRCSKLRSCLGLNKGSSGCGNAGFTVIELVVVIILLGIVSAVALPRFFDADGYRQRAAYDEVAGALRYAQKLAVASGCEVQVLLTGNSYALQQHATDCSSGSFADISHHPVTTATFSHVTLSPSPGTLVFDAMGRSNTAAVIDIGDRTIQVVAETGYVHAP